MGRYFPEEWADNRRSLSAMWLVCAQLRLYCCGSNNRVADTILNISIVALLEIESSTLKAVALTLSELIIYVMCLLR